MTVAIICCMFILAKKFGYNLSTEQQQQQNKKITGLHGRILNRGACDFTSTVAKSVGDQYRHGALGRGLQNLNTGRAGVMIFGG